MEPQIPAKPGRFEPSTTLVDILTITAVCAVAFFFGLGQLALIGPDEPRYAEVAREMFATGDYVSTRLCGCLWFEKPPLLYWLSAASYGVLGVGEFAARFPSALAALAIVLVVYIAVRKKAGRNAALMSAIVAATSAAIVSYARVATPDMLLALTMSVALLAAYEAIESDRQNAWPWIISGGATGLAALAKGLVGLVLIGAILTIAVLAKRRWRSVGPVALLSFVLPCLLVAAIWYLPVTMRHGWQFIDEFFIRHHFHRYTTEVFHHPQPVYFFLVMAFLGAMPWSLYLIPGAVRLRRLRPRTEKLDGLLLFSWIWAVVPVVFFSFSGSKLPGYILPVFPALAVIAGIELNRFLEGEPSSLKAVAFWGTNLIILAMAVAYLVLGIRESPLQMSWQGLLSVLPLALTAVTILLGLKRKFRPAAWAAAASVSAIIVGAVITLFTGVDQRTSLKPLSLKAAEALKPRERICFFIKKEFAPVFYAEGRVVCDEEGMDILNALREDILEAALLKEKERGSDSLIVITTSNWRAGLESWPRFGTELLAQQGDALAFRVSLR